jgi:hypothetical protein
VNVVSVGEEVHGRKAVDPDVDMFSTGSRKFPLQKRKFTFFFFFFAQRKRKRQANVHLATLVVFIKQHHNPP